MPEGRACLERHSRGKRHSEGHPYDDEYRFIDRCGCRREKTAEHFYRFHQPHLHLGTVFGDDWFALKAEAFARFFGTPFFLISQTIFVAIWIAVNVAGLTNFDIYPFILLNLHSACRLLTRRLSFFLLKHDRPTGIKFMQ